MVSINLPLNAIRRMSWNESSGHTGSAINVSAVVISYAPSDMFAVRRVHCFMAISAPSRLDIHHSSCLPSGSGIRTSQRNNTPWRLDGRVKRLVDGFTGQLGEKLGAYEVNLPVVLQDD